VSLYIAITFFSCSQKAAPQEASVLKQLRSFWSVFSKKQYTENLLQEAYGSKCVEMHPATDSLFSVLLLPRENMIVELKPTGLSQ